ncbi:hypothetical protein [Bauldia litoralis]|uniref:hypothetical protein n=1 Tax=Bauldia litoralis TaxID=665467 RepID=UPI00326665B1
MRLTDDQRPILDGIAAGRRIKAVVIRRGTTRHVRFGFSETEPVHKHALEGLVSRRILTIDDDGNFVEAKP